MIKFGQVTAYDARRGVATVAYIRPEACARCGACGGLSQTGTIQLKAECAVGDWVRVVLPDQRFVAASALAYAVPLCGFLGGLLAGYALSGRKEWGALAGSLAGLGLSMLALKLVEKAIAGRPGWTPRIDRVYDHRPDELDDIGCTSRE